ncbi:hypothetical protein MKX01_000242 [Papaver californicum]|nr:hypothetical protein MKX01_000242 [Papaver californicum]
MAATTTSQFYYFRSLQKSLMFTTRKTPSSIKSNRSSIIICNTTNNRNISGGRKLRAAVIGGGPAGSSAAEALSRAGIETYLIERSPSGDKPCGGTIPLCMLDEFSIPPDLIDRRVTQMKIISPSNLTVDFEKFLTFLRSRAESAGTIIINDLFIHLELPDSPNSPYTVHYSNNGSKESIYVDVVIGADGANKQIRLPDEKMRYYENLAEMHVFPKCDHVAVGTGTVCSKQDIKLYQNGVRERAKENIYGGKVIKVEAHPIPEHPRPRRDSQYINTFRFLDILQKLFYGNNAARECLVEICGCDYVQRMTFESYLYKKLARGNPWENVKMVVITVGSLIRSNIIKEEMDELKV